MAYRSRSGFCLIQDLDDADLRLRPRQRVANILVYSDYLGLPYRVEFLAEVAARDVLGCASGRHIVGILGVTHVSVVEYPSSLSGAEHGRLADPVHAGHAARA